MKFNKITILLHVFLWFVASAGAQITNGSFEFQLDGWTYNMGVYSIGNSGMQPIGVSGNLCADLGGGDLTGAMLSQTVSVVRDSDYELTFWSAANGSGAGQISIGKIEILTPTGTALASLNFTNISPSQIAGTNGFSQEKIAFTTDATETNITLRFSDITPGGGVGIDVAIDDVQIRRISGAPAGRVSFSLTSLSQLPDIVIMRTNRMAARTNITQIVTTRTKSSILLSKDILRLLSNSLTNLPGSIVTNGILHTDGEGGFFVITPTTTNNVSSVLSYTAGPRVLAGTQTTVTKTPPGTRVSEAGSVITTQTCRLIYDDTLLSTGDGTHTSISLPGVLVTRWTDTGPKFTQSIKLALSGDGMVQDIPVVIKSGTVSGNLTPFTDLDDL